MEVKLISYNDSGNIGDAIQTVALQRFINSVGIKCVGFANRGEIGNVKETLIVNGWHRGTNINSHKLPKRAIFVGLHAGEEQIKCIDKDITIGCRDWYTKDIADKLGYKTVLTGCPTSSLFVKIVNDPHTNKGADIDYPCTGHEDSYLTQVIHSGMKWNTQIGHAVERLNTLVQSCKIRTSRLHVFLPCLALGVDVELDYSSTKSPERFGVLSGLYKGDNKTYNKNIHIQGFDSYELRKQWENGFQEVLNDWKS